MEYGELREAVARSRHRTYIADCFRAAFGVAPLCDEPIRKAARERQAGEDLSEYVRLMRQRTGALDRVG